MNSKTKKYLERIEFSGDPHPTLNTLSALQKQHLLHVPFENLDVHRRVPVVIENSYHKIVDCHRGGFCYELNSAFHDLLKDSGFESYLISGRVYDAEKKRFGPGFDHMAIVVKLSDALWLVDVGFGEFCFHPLKIEAGVVQSDPRGKFKIEQAEGQSLLVGKQTEQGYKPEYIFTLQPRSIEDFEEMCIFHQTSPQSHFTQKRICSLPREVGRISLTENILKITGNGDAKMKRLQSEEEVDQVLKDYFGIRLEIIPENAGNINIIPD